MAVVATSSIALVACAGPDASVRSQEEAQAIVETASSGDEPVDRPPVTGCTTVTVRDEYGFPVEVQQCSEVIADDLPVVDGLDAWLTSTQPAELASLVRALTITADCRDETHDLSLLASLRTIADGMTRSEDTELRELALNLDRVVTSIDRLQSSCVFGINEWMAESSQTAEAIVALATHISELRGLGTDDA